MYENILIQSGLTLDEAKVYEALLVSGPQGARELVVRIEGIKRGLLYKVLDRLTEKGLVLTKKTGGKTVFGAQSPDALASLAKAQEEAARKAGASLRTALPELRAKYHLSTERPVIRFFEGVAGLREMYEEKIDSGVKDFYFIRTARAEEYREAFGRWFGNYLKRQTELGIAAHALTVDDEFTNHDAEIDRLRHTTRIWLRPEDYTAPVQIEAYGDMVAVFVFGKEIFGIMIENRPIATAVREILQLAERGAGTVDITHDHPPEKGGERE